MEIKNRIQKIIDNEGITNAKFADTVGVQRSSISHLLSGRNQPSLPVVLKILKAYSDINAEWLLFGRGSMYTSRNMHEESAEEAQEPPKNNPDSADPAQPGNNRAGQQSADIPQSSDNRKQKKPQDAGPQQQTEIPFANTEAPPFINNTHSNKQIDRIIILYTDGSFRHYSPEE